MSFDQFELILYDTFQMDAWMPPLYGRWTEEFKKSSYSQWAVDEIKEYVADKLYPKDNGDISEYCSLTEEFASKMSGYAKLGFRNRLIFQTAVYMSDAVVDLLRTMI